MIQLMSIWFKDPSLCEVQTGLFGSQWLNKFFVWFYAKNGKTLLALNCGKPWYLLKKPLIQHPHAEIGMVFVKPIGQWMFVDYYYNSLLFADLSYIGIRQRSMEIMLGKYWGDQFRSGRSKFMTTFLPAILCSMMCSFVQQNSVLIIISMMAAYVC